MNTIYDYKNEFKKLSGEDPKLFADSDFFLNLLRSFKDNLDAINRNDVEFVTKCIIPIFLYTLAIQEQTHQINDTFFNIFINSAALFHIPKDYTIIIIKTIIQNFAIYSSDTSILALRFIIDFHKIYRSELDDTVEDFIIFTVNYINSNYDILSSSKKILSLNDEKNLRILIELPVVIVMIFQLHRKLINENISRFILPMMKLLTTKIFFRYSDSILNEICLVKVKFLSFFAYIARSFIHLVKEYNQEIPIIIIDLFNTCPTNFSATRKVFGVFFRN